MGLVGDKIICIKDFDENLKLKGKIYEIVKVNYDSLIYSEGEEGGIISFKDFPIYFEMYEPKFSFHGWIDDSDEEKYMYFKIDNKYEIDWDIFRSLSNKLVNIIVEEIEE